MRSSLVVVLCLFLSQLALVAQTSQSTADSAPGVDATALGQQQSGDDGDRPVLKRRPKTGPDARVDDNPAVQNHDENTLPDQAPPTEQNGPVLGKRSPAPTRIPAATSIPVNTQFQVSLDESLSSKNAKPGDNFTATLEEPLRSGNGDVLIPSGTKVLGTVQDAESGKVFASTRGKGKLILRFNEIVLPSGERLRMQATLLSVGTNKAKASANQEGEITSGTRTGDAVKKVGIGAGVGTIAGMIFGSAWKGAAIGAIAGGGYAMANAGKEVEVPAHTAVNLRLDQYLVVTGARP